MFRDEDIWDEIIDAVLPDGDGCVAVLRAYIDASDREEFGLFSVAGYLIDSQRVRPFRKAWRRTFGDVKFSWADLIARQGPFLYLNGTEHRPEHDRLVKTGVSLVRNHFLAGSIVSCWTQDVQNLSPTWIRGFSSAFSINCHLCMATMGGMAKRHNYKGGIAYFIEAGDKFQSEATDLISLAAKSELARDRYQWSSHSCLPKTEASPFHAPDLLAWEMGKVHARNRDRAEA
jgi:hypothetical protein